MSHHSQLYRNVFRYKERLLVFALIAKIVCGSVRGLQSSWIDLLSFFYTYCINVFLNVECSNIFIFILFFDILTNAENWSFSTHSCNRQLNILSCLSSFDYNSNETSFEWFDVVCDNQQVSLLFSLPTVQYCCYSVSLTNH